MQVFVNAGLPKDRAHPCPLMEETRPRAAYSMRQTVGQKFLSREPKCQRGYESSVRGPTKLPYTLDFPASSKPVELLCCATTPILEVCPLEEDFVGYRAGERELTERPGRQANVLSTAQKVAITAIAVEPGMMTAWR